MVQSIIYVQNGKMFVIGMDTEKPVYYPITMPELKLMLKETQKVWDNASHHSQKTDSPYHAENAIIAEQDELADGVLG